MEGVVRQASNISAMESHSRPVMESGAWTRTSVSRWLPYLSNVLGDQFVNPERTILE